MAADNSAVFLLLHPKEEDDHLDKAHSLRRLNRNETVCSMADFLFASQHRCYRPHRCTTKHRSCQVIVKFFNNGARNFDFSCLFFHLLELDMLPRRLLMRLLFFFLYICIVSYSPKFKPKTYI